MQLVIHTDGGARGNPGPAAIGVVIEECDGFSNSHDFLPGTRIGKTVASFGKRIGETSNNVAEYKGVIEALKEIKRLVLCGAVRKGTGMSFFLDSTLVTNQLNGLFKVKKAHLRELLLEIRQLEQDLGGIITYKSVPREQNAAADILVNQALDDPTLNAKS